MAFQYRLIHIDESEQWIHISSDSDMDCEEPDAFVYFLKNVATDIGGKIYSVGDMQYKVDADRLDLVFQWDGVFGISIIYPAKENLEQVIEFLQQYCIS